MGRDRRKGIQPEALTMNKYCAISIMSRDENRYLKEWIDYHLLIGVDHIQIWDNESKIPIKETVKEYIDNKLVSVREIKGLRDIGRQCETQKKSMKMYLKQYKWVALLDTDEFIVLLEKEIDIKQYLKKYEQYGGVALNWMMFNANGHEKTPKSQIDSFTFALNTQHNKHIKTIARPKFYLTSPNPHFVESKRPIVNAKGEAIRGGPFNEPMILDSGMRINHYYTRSEEDWKIKMQRGPGGGNNHGKPKPKYNMEVFKKFQDMDGEHNYDIINLVKRIKDGQNSASDNDV